MEDAFVEIFVTADHHPDLLLGEPLLVEEEVGNGFRSHFDELSLHEKLQSLVCVKIEPLDRLEQLSLVFPTFASICRIFFTAIEVLWIRDKR